MHSTYLPVWLWVLGSHQERCTQDRRPRPIVFAKVVMNQIVPPRVEWRGETDNRAATPVGYCPSTASFSVRPRLIARMPDKTDARSIITASPSENWRKPPGRPRTTWMKTNQQDLRSNNLSLDETITVAQNRPLWRLMSAFGATHSKWCMSHKKKKRKTRSPVTYPWMGLIRNDYVR